MGNHRLMAKAADTLGYYTVVEDQNTGWTGGLLLLNQAGRPLEFQCTLPVRPSRAHEILFGDTLREHVIAEVIGKLLIEKCRNSISMLCCDLHEGISLSRLCSFPVVLLDQSDELHDETFDRYSKPRRSIPTKSNESVGSTHLNSQNPFTSLLARHRSDETITDTGEDQIVGSRLFELSGATLRAATSDCEQVKSIISGLTDLPDGAEPFERIREAIREAQSQISKASSSRPASAA